MRNLSKLIKQTLVGASCALLSGLPIVHASGGGAHWAYEGAEGPSRWGSLAREYSLCGEGRVQSPIDITDASDASLFKLEFNYQAVPLQILNNGHTIQINYGTPQSGDEHTIKIGSDSHALPSAVKYNSYISISGEKYQLLQVHFHSPSEHTIDGEHASMEAHFVHINSQNQLAVVGVMLKKGSHSSFIDTLWRHMPASPGGPNMVSNVSVNAADLLPGERSYYHYRGSLTTPPCSEGVRWFVMREPSQVASGQIQKFLSVINKNARPTQPLNDRFLVTTY